MLYLKSGAEHHFANRSETLARFTSKKSALLNYGSVDLNELVGFAEDLSTRVGIPKDTVTKKIPSANPATVESETYTTYMLFRGMAKEYTELVCSDIANTFEVTSSKVGDTPIPDYQLEMLLSPRAFSTLIWARAMLAAAFSRVRFRKINKFFTGPGLALTPQGPDTCILSKYGLIGDLLQTNNSNLVYNLDMFFSEEMVGYLSPKTNWRYSYTPSLMMQVPKTAKQNRTITVSSSLSLAAQHALTVYLDKVLLSLDIDITALSAEHQDRAMIASLSNDGESTVDFSSASDTISRGLVAILMNYEDAPQCVRKVYELIHLCRNQEYMYKDDIKSLYSIFSMGENCCFNFETLIFTILGRALRRTYNGKERITSFGDDLILPHGTDLSVFAEFGLCVNKEKSFTSGVFRESCGADYSKGRFVRGFYIKTRHPTTDDFIRCVNFFKVNYDVDDTLLWTYPFFRKIIFKYKLQNIYMLKSRFNIDTVFRHRNRILTNVLLIDNFKHARTGGYFRIAQPTLLVQKQHRKDVTDGWFGVHAEISDAFLLLLSSKNTNIRECSLRRYYLRASTRCVDPLYADLSIINSDRTALPNITTGLSRFRYYPISLMYSGRYDVATFFNLGLS